MTATLSEKGGRFSPAIYINKGKTERRRWTYVTKRRAGRRRGGAYPHVDIGELNIAEIGRHVD